MMDFETAAVNAFSAAFPAAQITGCYFRLCQSALRKINDIGLKKAYITAPKLLFVLKMVPEIALLPVEQVEEGFNLVMKEVGDILLRFKSDDEASEKVYFLLATSRQPTLEVLAEPFLNP